MPVGFGRKVAKFKFFELREHFISFDFVAFFAGNHAVFPCGFPPFRTGDDVINGDFLFS